VRSPVPEMPVRRSAKLAPTSPATYHSDRTGIAIKDKAVRRRRPRENRFRTHPEFIMRCSMSEAWIHPTTRFSRSVRRREGKPLGLRRINNAGGLPELNRSFASGATLPGFVEWKPSGIPSAAVSQPRGFSQFQFSLSPQPRWVPAPPAKSALSPGRPAGKLEGPPFPPFAVPEEKMRPLAGPL
jgi:hypothetical protein